MGETSKAQRVTLPDCMMPDGAEPCIAYQQMADRLAEAEALLREVEKRIGPIDASGSLRARIKKCLSGGEG